MSKKPIHKIWYDKSETWHLDGFLHREDGPAVIYPSGKGEEWWLNGFRHRKDGPAKIGSDGYEAWFLNNRRHREDGPAVMYPVDNDCDEYYLNGNCMSFNIWIKLSGISDEKKIELKLMYG